MYWGHCDLDSLSENLVWRYYCDRVQPFSGQVVLGPSREDRIANIMAELMQVGAVDPAKSSEHCWGEDEIGVAENAQLWKWTAPVEDCAEDKCLIHQPENTQSSGDLEELAEVGTIQEELGVVAEMDQEPPSDEGEDEKRPAENTQSNGGAVEHAEVGTIQEENIALGEVGQRSLSEVAQEPQHKKRKTDVRGRFVRQAAGDLGKPVDQLIPSQRLITVIPALLQKRHEMDECVSRGDYLDAEGRRQQLKALEANLRNCEHCQLCAIEAPLGKPARDALSERWYGAVTHPICAFCNTNDATPIPNPDATVRSLVLASLRHRVYKECASAEAMIPSSIPKSQRKSWHARLRVQAGATRGRRQVRLQTRGQMQKHIVVSHLWRTLSRIQLQPELAEQSRCVHELLCVLTSNCAIVTSRGEITRDDEEDD